MPERLPCKNPDCPNTILPITGELTGGLCMPCKQGEERKKFEANVRENRRDVNDFEGQTDPVEIIKIVHKPRGYDPLVNWIPYPTPTDQLYLCLDSNGIKRLTDYAEDLIENDRFEEAEEICLCLSAFCGAPLDNCLHRYLTSNSDWPLLAFRQTNGDIRDELLKRIDSDEDNRNLILIALAWIGDDKVVEHFAKWRSDPPKWRPELHIPPEDYSFEAGWELDEKGKRRNLYLDTARKLVKGSSQSLEDFCVIAPSTDSCPWCAQQLTRLIQFDPQRHGMILPFPTGWNGAIGILTCEICTAFGVVHGIVDDEGTGRWSSANVRPKYLPEDAGTWGRISENSLRLGEQRPAYFAADWSLPTTVSQLGGHPTWVQDAHYPSCPVCSRSMIFVAQIDQGEIDEMTEGLYYAFLCPDCRTTATTYQQT